MLNKNKFKITGCLLLLILFVFSFGYSQPDIQFSHSNLKWKSIETEHFVVNYSQGTERTANIIAKIAEEIFPHITGLYQFVPDTKTEFIVQDTDDYSNGGAYFYDNKILIYSENLDYVLRGTHNWLRDVVTHEYTHIISIQKALKFGKNIPAAWLQLFRYEKERRTDVVRGFPHNIISYPISGITIPVWYAEGTAQFHSPTARYDYRDSHREMIVRDRVMTGNLLDLKQMSVFGKNSVGNESSYNQGFAFVKFLAETFGDSVVTELAVEAAKPLTLDFYQVLKNVTGISADSLYNMWHNSLKGTYTRRLEKIQNNLSIGVPVRNKGIGNLNPVFSPDGHSVAYLQNNSDYITGNLLVIKNLRNNKVRKITGPVASTLSWSPDGRYLTYAKQTLNRRLQGTFRELYIYDVKQRKELKLTDGMRATNPDWSHTGNKISFVTQTDGQTNLCVLTLGDLRKLKKDKKWQHVAYEFSTAKYVSGKKEDDLHFRDARYLGASMKQITFWNNGRQIFHPRWSPDDSEIYFDTSIKFGRDIAKIPADGGEFSFVLNSPADERFPNFQPGSGKLYYSSDRTGIFNIYARDLANGNEQIFSNVVGGAFTPSANAKGDIVYSLYKDQGYKIYLIKSPEEMAAAVTAYIPNYPQTVPQIAENDESYEPLPTKPYQRKFTSVSFMPRLLIDYGTIKPGFYFYSSELLEKMNLFGGFDVNKDREYNLFLLYEYRYIAPILYLEFYNQSAKIDDDYEDASGFTVSDDQVPVSFNLMEANVGARGEFHGWEFKLNYAYSMYRAKIGTHTYLDLSENKLYTFPNVRYTYLRGGSTSFSLKKQEIAPYVDRAINPSKGYYFFLKYYHDRMRFLDGFNTSGGDLNEEYLRYNYNKIEMDAELYFPIPLADRHSLSMRFQGGVIDRTIDDFFNFFAGSLVGLKGYPYYSIDGNKMAIGTATYRFPLARNLNFKLLNWYVDKIYLGGFYQYGNAWSGDEVDFAEFKSDAGVQLRIETYSWYMFPTRIFFEAAYPLDEQIRGDIIYKKEWKYYFGVLFDFDLRFDKVLRKLR